MNAFRLTLALLVVSLSAEAGPATNYAYVRTTIADLGSNGFNGRWIDIEGSSIYTYDPAGSVLVTDLDGSPVRTVPMAGDLRALDADSVGNVYAVFLTGGPIEVRKVDAAGTTAWTESFSTTGSAVDLAVLSTEKVLLLDGIGATVRVLDTGTGALLDQWGSTGTGNGLPGELVNANAIRVWNDQVFVAARGSGDEFGQLRAIDAYDASGNLQQRVVTYYHDVGPLLPFAIDGGAIYFSNGHTTSSFGLHRVSALSNGIVSDDFTNSSLDFIRVRVRQSENLSAFAVHADRLYLYDQQPATILEYRQGSGLIPGTDSLAFPVPYIATQTVRPGEPILDLEYQVDDLDSATVEAALLARINGGNRVQDWVRAASFANGTESNLGTVDANTPMTVAWDFGTDLADAGSDVVDVALEVLAKDARGLLGVSLIELPAGIPDGAGSPLVISTLALRGSDFVDAYRWLFASGDPAVAKATDSLIGTASAVGFENQALVSIDMVTNAGIDYLLAREGLRRATAAEVTRAQEAATVGTVNRFDPYNALGDRPAKVNEYGIETSETAQVLVYAVSEQ